MDRRSNSKNLHGQQKERDVHLEGKMWDATHKAREREWEIVYKTQKEEGVVGWGNILIFHQKTLPQPFNDLPPQRCRACKDRNIVHRQILRLLLPLLQRSRPTLSQLRNQKETNPALCLSLGFSSLGSSWGWNLLRKYGNKHYFRDSNNIYCQTNGCMAYLFILGIEFWRNFNFRYLANFHWLIFLWGKTWIFSSFSISMEKCVFPAKVHHIHNLFFLIQEK